MLETTNDQTFFLGRINKINKNKCIITVVFYQTTKRRAATVIDHNK